MLELFLTNSTAYPGGGQIAKNVNTGQQAQNEAKSDGKHIDYSNVLEKKMGSSRSFVDLCETDQYSLFEIPKVTKTITHSFNRLNGVIDAFNDAGRKPMGEVVQHILFPIV